MNPAIERPESQEKSQAPSEPKVGTPQGVISLAAVTEGGSEIF